MCSCENVCVRCARVVVLVRSSGVIRAIKLQWRAHSVHPSILLLCARACLTVTWLTGQSISFYRNVAILAILPILSVFALSGRCPSHGPQGDRRRLAETRDIDSAGAWLCACIIRISVNIFVHIYIGACVCWCICMCACIWGGALCGHECACNDRNMF